MADTNNARLLTDVRFVRLSLDEASSNGKIVVKGEFAKCGIATENKRVYPESIWNKEISRLDKALGEKRVFGEMDHPADGRTSLNRVSHIVTSLKVSKDGIVIGEAEVLPTEAGKNLSALLASGCKVGVSSRGYGSTKSNDKGEEVVQPDYKLVTFDFVAEPADGDAYPAVQEGKNFVFEGVDMNRAQEKAEQEKAAEFARKIEQEQKNGGSNADVREEFSTALLDNIVKMKAEAKAEAKAEMLADPAIGGAKQFVEKIKELVKPFWHEGDAKAALEAKDAEITKLKNQLAESDLKIKTLEDNNTKLAAVAKEAGYKYWLERTLANDPDADLILKSIGDVKAFEKADDLKAKVEELKKGFQTKREESKKAEEARQKEIADATKKVEEAKKAAEEKAAKLEEALEKALQAEKQLALKMLAEQRLRNHPQAKKLRPLVESQDFESKEEVEKFFNDYREAPKDDDELEVVRARVRKMNEGGDEDLDSETLSEDREERSPKKGEGRDYNGLGVSIGELKKLSGNVGAPSKR
jgi:hypothetical protein